MTFWEIYLWGVPITFCVVAFLDPKPREHGLFCDIFAYSVVGVFWPGIWFLQILQFIVMGLQWAGSKIRG